MTDVSADRTAASSVAQGTRDVGRSSWAASPDDFIQLLGVGKTYATADGPTVALSRVEFGIRKGEFITIVGPSGCGKTTLLRIISGLLGQSEGAALMAGTPITGPRPDIGIVFQKPELLPWRSALKNVLLPAELMKAPKREAEQRARDLLALVGLGGFENHLPDQLSGGMQQRAAIARALFSSPSLLLMDEPFGALDAMTREQLGLELQRIRFEDDANEKTVFFITHSISEAVFLGDRVIVMTPGPGRIAEVIDVPFARPRELNLMNSGGLFGEIVARIRHLLSSNGSEATGGEG